MSSGESAKEVKKSKVDEYEVSPLPSPPVTGVPTPGEISESPAKTESKDSSKKTATDS